MKTEHSLPAGHPIIAGHSISTEQGDINTTLLRQQFMDSLDGQTRHLIEEDARYFMHQALSTPVMNVLTRTEGAYIYDLNGKNFVTLVFTKKKEVFMQSTDQSWTPSVNVH